MKTLISRRRFLQLVGAGVVATGGLVSLEIDDAELAPEAQAGWSKDPASPVLGGGALGSCFDPCVRRDGDLLRMWYSSRPTGSIAHATSCDGKAWSAPQVVLRGRGSGWEDIVNRAAVLRYGGAWRMYYTGQTSGHSNIGLAESTDGIGWKRRSRPVFAAQEAWEERNVMSPYVIWDGAANVFRMWYSGGPQYEPRAIGHATSSDGVYWARTPQPVFQPAGGLWPLVWDGDRVTACHVEPVDGGYLMFYAGFRDVNHAAIGMAHSRDGVNDWRRFAGNPILRRGHIGSWDSDAVYRPSVLREDDGWRLWYNGRHDSQEQIGLAAHPGLDIGV